MKRKSLWLCFVLVLAAVALGVAVRCRNVTTVEVVFAFSDLYKPELRENGKVNFVGMFDADEAPEYSGMDLAGTLLDDLNECKAQIVSNVTAVVSSEGLGGQLAMGASCQASSRSPVEATASSRLMSSQAARSSIMSFSCESPDEPKWKWAEITG